jgi:hypothetical protein
MASSSRREEGRSVVHHLWVSGIDVQVRSEGAVGGVAFRFESYTGARCTFCPPGWARTEEGRGGGISLLGEGGGAGGSLRPGEGFGRELVAGCHCEDVASVVWPRSAARAASRNGTRRAFRATPRSPRGRVSVNGENMDQEGVDRHGEKVSKICPPSAR